MSERKTHYYPALLRLASIACFAAMALCVRFASFEAPVGQIVFFRGVFALFPLVIYVFWQGGFRVGFTTKIFIQHIVRGCVGTTALVCAFISYAYLPLAEATLFTFLTPVVSLLLSAIALKERPSLLVIFSVILGTAGVLTAFSDELARSGAVSLGMIGVACGISGAVLSSGAYILIRRLAQIELPSRIGFYFALMLSILAAPTIALGWVMPSANLWFLLASAGILGGIGHIAMTEAFARASVGSLAPYEYTSLFWSLLFDAALFQILPSTPMIVGGSLIVLAAAMASMIRTPQPSRHQGTVQPADLPMSLAGSQK